MFETNAFSQGHWVPNPIVPAASSEWSIPIDQLGPEGRKLYEHSTAEAKKLLAEAGHPNGFKTQVETPAVVYGPDFMDSVQIDIKNWKAAGIDAELKIKEYGAFISSTIYGKFDHMFFGLRGGVGRPRILLLPHVHAGPAAQRLERERSQAHRDDHAPAAHVRRRQAKADRLRHPALPAEQGYAGADGSVKVVSAWEPYIKNYMPNNGFDYGGRLMAAWIDK